MEEERLSLQSSAAGVSLEQVLVFETVVDFDCQANLLPGLVEAPALPRRGLTGGGDWGLFGGMAGLDLFISYSGKDRPWAVWLDFVLREAGYSTKLQEYDFVPGESFPAAIHEALVHSRFVVCLLSPAYLESWWCGEEWQTALSKKNLFPVRIVECKPDGLLTIHAYVDVAGTSEAEAEKRILEGLARREGKDVRPKDRPDFPDRVKGQARPRFPGELPRIWNITEARNPYFTGRDEILRRLHEELGAGKQAALTQAIAGLGGVGKTQLAMEYAYRHASEYEGVWWLHAESPATLAAEYAALGPHLGVEMMTDQGAMIREVRARLAQQQGILLIFDNATQPSTLKPYLPLGPSQRVIVTTRAQYWPGAKAQEVPVLKLEQAVKFLFERTGRVRQVSIQSDRLQLRAGDAGARPPTRDSVAHTHCPQDSRGSHWQSPRAPSGRA